MWLQVPLRSLLRNRRRTALSIAIIALGTAISLFVLGFFADATRSIQESTVQEFGTLQIAARSLWDDTAEGYEYLLSQDDLAQVEEALASEETVVSRSTQLSFPGLVASGKGTKVVFATALVPGNETLDFNDLVVEGRGLEPTDAAAVLVGRSFAEQLQIKTGDVITLTVTTVGGAFNASPLEVAGIYQFTSSQVESQQIFLPLEFGQLLLNTNGVDRLVVMLNDLDSTEPGRARIQADLDLLPLNLEAKTWDKLSPFYEELTGYFNALFGVVTLAVSVLVFFIILQVLTMSFLERTREIGTIRALGTKRGEVFRLFFTESAWLALLGSGTGIVFGVVLGLAFNTVGIEWQPPGTVEPVVLGIRLAAQTAWLPFVVSVVATLLSAIFPAVQSARLQVADALRVT
jgi:putative ABC transport system permease protein